MKNTIITFLMLAGITGLTSCYEQPEPGTAKIIVIDQNEFRVPSANVHLSQPGQLNTGFIDVEGLTDMNGEFLYIHEDFQVDHGLEVILDIHAEKNGLNGLGIIRIKPNETTTQTVKIQ